MIKFFWVIISLLALPLFVSAAPLSGYAWSENIGWIKFSGPGYGVDLDPITSVLSGYAWSENIGWIKFNANGPDWARACAGAQNADCTGAANIDAGGWDGFIKLRGDGYGIRSGTRRCRVRGWAWGSDVIGWIHFSGPTYSVQAAGCPEEEEEEEEPVTLPTCDFSPSPGQVAIGGKTTLRWNCFNTANSCSLADLGIINGPQQSSVLTGPLSRTTRFILECENEAGRATFTTTVTVIRPLYCEIIPFLGTCK